MDQEDRYQRGWGLPREQRFNYASTLRRIGAYIIDIILLLILTGILFFAFIVFGLLSWELFLETEPDTVILEFYSASYLILLLISSIIDLVYFTVLESEKGGGATIGKRILDIKVIDEYGKKIDLVSSFIRNIVRLLWQIPCIGLIILIIDVFLIADSEQRIGDRLAYTYVVDESKSIRGYPAYGTSQGYPRQQWNQGPYSSKKENRKHKIPPPPPPDAEKVEREKTSQED